MTHQLAFYAKRMREEAAIRRTGMIFVVLAFLVQFMAVVSPPAITADANYNDMVNQGIASDSASADTAIANAHKACVNNDRNYKSALNYLGIQCSDIQNATKVTIHAADCRGNVNGDVLGQYNTFDDCPKANKLFSMGWTNYGYDTNPTSGRDTGQVGLNIPGTPNTLFARKLHSFDGQGINQQYTALKLKVDGQTWYILFGCGNLVSIGVPHPPASPPPTCQNGGLDQNGPVCHPTCQNGGITDQKVCNPTCQNGGITDQKICHPTCQNGGVTDQKICNPTCQNGGITDQRICNPTCQNGGIPATSPACNPTCQNGGLDPNGPICHPTCQNGGITDQKICHPTCQNGGITDQRICNPTCQNGGVTDQKICNPTCQNGGITDQKICNPTCQNGGIPANSPTCNPTCENGGIPASQCHVPTCPQQSSDNPCASYHKSATNLTQGIANANGTTAHAGDVIVYTLSVRNVGKAPLVNFVFTEDLDDVMDYALPIDLHGGTLGTDNQVTWPAVTINPGQLVTKQIAVKVKSPIPTTPTNPHNTYKFDLVMTNTFGDTVNIHLPSPPIKTVSRITTTQLVNTGPGTGLFIAGAVVFMAAFFYSRARLLQEESTVAVQEANNA
ncbi:MAG TPA: hypothetical protein VG604_03240 [Candidatus Saccharimonadales bacterium]|nr:hypothetical protein [Candidatus Saccharimonadales bacterium]